MAFQSTACCEAVLKQPCEQRFFSGKGRQAVANVTRRLHTQLPPQHTTAAAVISDRDDGGEVAAVALEAAQQSGEPRAAADGHDVGAAIQAPLRQQGINKGRVFLRSKCALD